MSNNNIKMIAFHLPQYHTFPENDKWWGKGFTEWVNVKKAVPLFKGHNQPRVPMDNNYYDLSKDEDFQKQIDLAKENGLYGFCFYHYWFDGKLLLEKPIEKLLHIERKINYCFCWANEPWTRSWDGNVKDVIMPQNYGGQEDWEKHFLYLLPFFKDEYYIKKENKPFLVIYRTNSIPNCNDMIEYWDKRCKEEGFAGLYLVEEMNSFQKKGHCENASAILEFEPMNTLTNRRSYCKKAVDYLCSQLINIKNKTNLLIYQYDDVWNRILKHKYNQVKEKNVYLGAFVDWDNTPRKGKKGLVIQGACPKKFQKYLSLQKERAQKYGSEFIFINAWNEWGEGTYLEPDTKNRDAYLKAIQLVENETIEDNKED